jgi:hypothetical protein
MFGWKERDRSFSLARVSGGREKGASSSRVVKNISEHVIMGERMRQARCHVISHVWHRQAGQGVIRHNGPFVWSQRRALCGQAGACWSQKMNLLVVREQTDPMAIKKTLHCRTGPGTDLTWQCQTFIAMVAGCFVCHKEEGSN